jgi:hypothetical protein
MSACFYPPLASIPCDFATGYRRLPGFRPGDNPEVISSPVGLVPTNAQAVTDQSLERALRLPDTNPAHISNPVSSLPTRPEPRL